MIIFDSLSRFPFYSSFSLILFLSPSPCSVSALMFQWKIFMSDRSLSSSLSYQVVL